jgi:hypothetical protein
MRVALICAAVAWGVGCAHRADHVLPLTKVRLYETGVAYFERSGPVQGATSLPVPSSHVDDALKSMVVLAGDGEVTGVAFDSRESPAVARTRAALPGDTEVPLDLDTVLAGLRGEAVELRLRDGRVRGRVLDLVTSERQLATRRAGESEGEEAEDPPAFVLLIRPDGEVTRTDVAGVMGVLPLDARVRARHGQALDAVADLRSNAGKMLEVVARATGPVTLGYLAEAPVWRSTYRLVFASGAAQLQGWALVHNDTDEDWHGVRVELVNGRPDSFLHPMAAPRYERRELVVPNRTLSSVPQLSTRTPDAMWGDFVDDAGRRRFGSGRGGFRGRSAGSGYAGGAGTFRSRPKESSSSLLTLGDLARVAGAEGHEANTLFVYEVSRRIDLRAHRSSLVPFVHAPIDATAITWFDELADGQGRHALRFVNDTPQTLPEGSLAVFDHGGFAGEAMLQRLKPGERQFVQVGEDLDVEMRVTGRKRREEAQRLALQEGELEEHFVRTDEVDIALDNRSGHSRAVHIRINAVVNATVEGADRLDFDVTRNSPLAIVDLDAGARGATRTLTVAQALSRRTAVGSLTAERLRELAGATALPEPEREVARVAVERQEALEAADKELTHARAQVTSLGKDIERLRAHVAALGDREANTARHPLVVRLVAAEDRLEEARRTVERHAANVEVRKQGVREALAGLPEAP